MQQRISTCCPALFYRAARYLEDSVIISYKGQDLYTEDVSG